MQTLKHSLNLQTITFFLATCLQVARVVAVLRGRKPLTNCLLNSRSTCTRERDGDRERRRERKRGREGEREGERQAGREGGREREKEGAVGREDS